MYIWSPTAIDGRHNGGWGGGGLHSSFLSIKQIINALAKHTLKLHGFHKETLFTFPLGIETKRDINDFEMASDMKI